MQLTTSERNVPRVLIVDDEPLARSFLRTALEERARVFEAEDGEHAVTLLQTAQGHFDLVLMDYILPRRSGLDVLRIVKDTWPSLPVVIFTGFGSEDLAVQAFRAGASDYLTKPIQLKPLLDTVAALITPRLEIVPGNETLSCQQGCRAPVHSSIRRAHDFIHEHFTEAITLADVARAAGLSRFHFCRLFHRETGMPFHDYVHELRVNRAKALLADRHLSVTEVAYGVGFNDLSHFDRTFRRIVGQSPSEYRASLRCA